jgi:drug/metabolite transporter (DMT)-like permease
MDQSAFREKIPMIKLALAPVIWGGALAAGRVVSAELPAITTTCLRFSFASIFMIAALFLKEKRLPRPKGKDLIWIFLMSLVGVVFFNILLFSSLQTITAVRSSVMLAFTPSLVAVAAFFLFRERISNLMLIGILASTVGAVLTITSGNIRQVIRSGFAIGDIYMILAVLVWAAYSIIAKFAMSNLTPLTLLTYGSILGVLMLLPFSIAEGGWPKVLELSWPAIWSMLYLSLGAAGLAYLWYYEGIKHVGSSKASVFLNLEPVAAIIIGVLALNEPFSGAIAVGAILVICGLYLTTYRKKR